MGLRASIPECMMQAPCVTEEVWGTGDTAGWHEDGLRTSRSVQVEPSPQSRRPARIATPFSQLCGTMRTYRAGKGVLKEFADRVLSSELAWNTVVVSSRQFSPSWLDEMV